MIFQRLKRLWELSKYEIHEIPSARKDAGSNRVYNDLVMVNAEAKPKGAATIVDMTDPLEADFPTE